MWTFGATLGENFFLKRLVAPTWKAPGKFRCFYFCGVMWEMTIEGWWGFWEDSWQASQKPRWCSSRSKRGKHLENNTISNHSILYRKYIQNDVEQPQMTIGSVGYSLPKISWSKLYIHNRGGFLRILSNIPPSHNLVKIHSCPPLTYTSTFAGHMGHMGQRAFDA